MERAIRLLRWLGRLSGLILFCVIFAVVVGETFPHLREDGWSRFVKVPSLIFWVIYLIGLLLGWKWEGIGGGLSLLAVSAWIITNTLKASHWGISGHFWMFLIVPGVLLSACSILEKRFCLSSGSKAS